MLTKQPPRPLCKNCGLVPGKLNGKSKLGFKKWHKYCVDCSKIMYSKKHKHLANKKNVCEDCKFIPVDRCQLDLIYIDGNKKNKKTKNLKTLCANCSRVYRKKVKSKTKSILNFTVDADVRIN